jgi:hypothetical protein
MIVWQVWLLAPNGHGTMSVLSPLSRVKRKSYFGTIRSVDDPKRTFGIVRLTFC